MPRRSLLLVVGWLAAAVSAVVIGVIAVSLLGQNITNSESSAMNQRDIEEALKHSASSPRPSPESSSRQADRTTTKRTTTTPATPRTTSKAAPTSKRPSTPRAGQSRGFGSPGGQVVARCRSGNAYLVSWSPAQGFVVDDVDRGPDDDASVTFQSGERDVDIEVRCRSGVPRAIVDDDGPDDDDDDDG